MTDTFAELCEHFTGTASADERPGCVPFLWEQFTDTAPAGAFIPVYRIEVYVPDGDDDEDIRCKLKRPSWLSKNSKFLPVFKFKRVMARYRKELDDTLDGINPALIIAPDARGTGRRLSTLANGLLSAVSKGY